MPGPSGWRARLQQLPRAARIVVPIALAVAGVLASVFVLTRSSAPLSHGSTDTTASASVTPGSSTSPTASLPVPSPSVTPMTPQRRDAYCAAWKQIKTAQPGTNDEDGDNVDFAALAKTFARLHSQYSAARAVAPASLVNDYSTVVGYIEQSQAAIKSKDLDQVKVMVTHLGALDRFMSAIQAKSQRLCA